MSRRQREAELARDVAVFKEALEQSERTLLLERVRLGDDVEFWRQIALDERELRIRAEKQRDRAEIDRAIAEVGRDLLMESSRCLPVLIGDNVWEASGPAPIYDELRRAS